MVAQRGVWRGAEGSAEVATRFRLADGLVAELERYDGLADALRAAGLTTADVGKPG